MHSGGSLEGRVLDARDHPVEGARVVVAAMRGTLERATRSASDGTFAFASLPDEVSLTAGVDEDDAQPDVRMTVSIPEGGKKEVTVHLPAPRVQPEARAGHRAACRGERPRARAEDRDHRRDRRVAPRRAVARRDRDR